MKKFKLKKLVDLRVAIIEVESPDLGRRYMSIESAEYRIYRYFFGWYKLEMIGYKPKESKLYPLMLQKLNILKYG